MVARDVIDTHLLLQENNQIKNVLVLKENARRISPPHVYDVTEKNQVCDAGVGLKFAEETNKRGFVGSINSEMLVRDGNNRQVNHYQNIDSSR
jgi:hypothetical protein